MWVSRITGTWRWTRSSSWAGEQRHQELDKCRKFQDHSFLQCVHTIINGLGSHQRHQKRYIMFHTKSTGRTHLKQIIIVIDSIYWYNWNFNNQIRLQSEKTRLGNAIRRIVSFAVDIHNQKYQKKRRKGNSWEENFETIIFYPKK